MSLINVNFMTFDAMMYTTKRTTRERERERISLWYKFSHIGTTCWLKWLSIQLITHIGNILLTEMAEFETSFFTGRINIPVKRNFKLSRKKKETWPTRLKFFLTNVLKNKHERKREEFIPYICLNSRRNWASKVRKCGA